MIALRKDLPDDDELQVTDRPHLVVPPADLVPLRRSRWSAPRGSLRLARRVSRVRELPDAPRAPLRRIAPARIALDRVASTLASRPKRRTLVIAIALAVLAHVTFASWSLAQQPSKKSAGRITMAVPPPAPEVVEEIVEELPPPTSTPSSSASSAAPSSAIALPGPILPGVAAAGDGEGGGGSGVSVGSGGSGTGDVAVAGDTDDVDEPRVEAPRPRTRAAPEFPRRAREQGISGYVSLNILVGADGSVRDVRILDAQPPGIFDDAALAAARRFMFDPGTTNGNATEAWVKQTIRFTLD